MSYLYDWLQNYGLVIIVFNVIFKLLLMPLSFKSQKSMAKQRFLQDDINEIKRVYANDPQRASEAQMELMRANGVSMGGGCLPSLFSILLLFGIWPPIQRPLHYIGRVGAEQIEQIGQFMFEKQMIGENVLKSLPRTDVSLLASLKENGEALSTAVKEGWLELKQVLDLNFLGMDLGKTPSFLPAKLFGEESGTYLPLLLLVVILIVTMLISLRLNKINMPSGMTKEERERENRNPAKKGQTPDQSEGMMKSMQIFMPIMMLFSAFTLPAAMTIFWISSNLLAILQTWLTYKLYTEPMQAALDERYEKKLAGRRRKNK